jgi:hypothetical protein
MGAVGSPSGCRFEANGYAEGVASIPRGLVFSSFSTVATSLHMFGTMDDNNTPRSAASLSMFVVMAVVPIAVYVVAVLVLPWVGRSFH